MSFFSRSDVILGAFLVVLGVVLGLLSSQIVINPNLTTLSARFFPLLMCGFLVLFGFVLILRPGAASLKATLDALLVRRALLLAGLLAAYFLSFRYVDFRVGTFVFVALTMMVFGSRDWRELLIVPALVAALVYVIFRFGFTILLPTWM